MSAILICLVIWGVLGVLTAWYALRQAEYCGYWYLLLVAVLFPVYWYQKWREK